MLTKELLLHTTRKGKIRPRFLDRKDTSLSEAIEDLLGMARHAVGTPKKEVDEAMAGVALAHRKPKVVRGLVKLIGDRLEVEEAGETALELRWRAFEAAMEALKEGGADASFESFEASVEAKVGVEKYLLRDKLHEDLPDARKISSFEDIEADALVDRYDLAQCQGLAMYSNRLELTVDGLARPEVRRLLRWLRFCRLVAEVSPLGTGCRIAVEGPAAIFDGTKGYGLQLATFLAGVPSLSKWTLSAEVRLPRKPAATLELSDADPLSPRFFKGGAGYVPSEMKAVLEKLNIPGWTVDLSPPPRPTGARGLCVPDFALVPDGTGSTGSTGAPVVVELFHRWHKGALSTRLDELEQKDDPELSLGVDRALLSDKALAARVEAHPRAFLFRGFPGTRALEGLVKKTSFF